VKPAVCPKWPEKLRFPSRTQAERTASRYSWQHSKAIAVYECRLADGGCGDFHLTTHGASLADVMGWLDGDVEEDVEDVEDEGVVRRSRGQVRQARKFKH
jgi:hypothetical protein